jgi:hypothetical protein
MDVRAFMSLLLGRNYVSQMRYDQEAAAHCLFPMSLQEMRMRPLRNTLRRQNWQSPNCFR